MTTMTYKYWVSDLSLEAQSLVLHLLAAEYARLDIPLWERLTLLNDALNEKLDNLDEILSLDQRTKLRNMGGN